jgi:hypothetical protein
MNNRGISKAYIPLICTVMAGLIVILQFGFVFLLMALLPAIMAYFVDHYPGKPVFKTVLAANFTGTLPSLLPMLSAGLQFKYNDISATLTNPRVWLVVYGAAAAGWCLIYLCRLIARFLLIIAYEYRIVSLERFQKKLVEEWGQQVKQEEAESP